MPVIRFDYKIPLEQTMEFDSIYPEGLQFTLSEKEVIRSMAGAIFVWMPFTGTPVQGQARR